MSLYSLSLFLHVLGALALVGAIAVEGVGISGVRRAATADQAAAWLRLAGAPRRAMPPAVLTILLTGIHMSATRWGWQGWIVAGLTGMVAMAIVGPALGIRRFRAIGRALAAEKGELSGAARRLLRDPVLALSLRLRGALFVGVVYLMTTKPGPLAAFVALGVAAIGGLVVGLPSRRVRSGAVPASASGQTRA